MNNLSVLYFNGQGVSKDYAEGRVWLEKAVKNGNERARYWMGRYIFFGQFGYTTIVAKGKFLIEQAASNGNIDAMKFLADNSRYPRDYFGKDINYFLKWTRMAAEAGDSRSMFSMYSSDASEVLLSQAERDKWLIKAAEAGYRLDLSSGAEWHLAGRYIMGKDVDNSTIERDLHKAWFWAKKFILEQASKASSIDGYSIDEFFKYKIHTIKEIYDGAPDLRDDITDVLNQFNMLYMLYALR